MDPRFFGSVVPPGVQTTIQHDNTSANSSFVQSSINAKIANEPSASARAYTENVYKPSDSYSMGQMDQSYPVSFENMMRPNGIETQINRGYNEPSIIPIKPMAVPKVTHPAYSPYMIPAPYSGMMVAQPIIYDANNTFYQRATGSPMNKKTSQKARKTRLSWNSQLHRRFVEAVVTLGMKSAVPRGILDLMNVNGLTRENVASHLQKFRIQVKDQYKLKSTSDITDDHIPLDLDDDLRIIAERAQANRKSNFSINELKNSSRMPEMDLDDLIEQLHPAPLASPYGQTFTPQHYPMATNVPMHMQPAYMGHHMDMMRQNPY